MNSPQVIKLVHNIVSSSPKLAGVKEWNQANSLLTLASPGGSIGVEKEVFEAYTRDDDEATAYMSIVIWVKNADPVAGEAAVRALAQAARAVLNQNRTLAGAVADSFVYSITYATADGGKSLLLHLAELDYRVTYYAARISQDIQAEAPAVTTMNRELMSYE